MSNYINIENVLNKINLRFGIEWSGAEYLALDCKCIKGKHYPFCVIEFVTDRNKVSFAKIFDHKNKSVEYYGKFRHSKADDKIVTKVVKAFNIVEPS